MAGPQNHGATFWMFLNWKVLSSKLLQKRRLILYEQTQAMTAELSCAWRVDSRMCS